jgi:vancomycin permeability regulator SanA
MPRRFFLLRKAKYAFAALLAWVLVHTLLITLDGLHDGQQRADIAVILGNKVEEDGTLSERLTQRLACGLALYRSGRVPRLLVSGGLGKEGFYEGTKMRDYLRAHSVPANCAQHGAAAGYAAYSECAGRIAVLPS